MYGPANIIALSSSHKNECATVLYDPSDFSILQPESELLQSAEILIHAGAFTPKSARDANCITRCNGNISFADKLSRIPFTSLKRLIYLSTIDVYEPSELITESTPTQPSSLYGISKLYCERMMAEYAKQSGIQCQILRIGHIYGPGEEAYQKFIPQTIRSILKGEDVELWGDGNDLRSYLFIDDVVKAIVSSIDRPEVNETINLVSGNALSIRCILEYLIHISQKHINIVPRESRESRRDYVFDNSRMQRLIPTKETDLLTGLREEYSHIANLK